MIHIELLFRNVPVKSSWTDLSLVWFAGATPDKNGSKNWWSEITSSILWCCLSSDFLGIFAVSFSFFADNFFCYPCHTVGLEPDLFTVGTKMIADPDFFFQEWIPEELLTLLRDGSCLDLFIVSSQFQALFLLHDKLLESVWKRLIPVKES